MVDSIGELSEVARKLNQKSDTLNKTIGAVNEKLAKLNIGLEAWLDAPLEASDPYDWYENDDKYQEYPILRRDETLVGYCKVSDEWQLATKQVTVGPDDRGNKFAEVVGAEQPSALSKAPRHIRVAAMESIPNLLDVLKSNAEAALQDVDEAEKAAEKL